MTEKMNGKSSFVLYHDIREPLEMLSDEERGKLFTAILNYSEHGDIPDFSGALQMAFAFIRTALDRDAEKWEDKRQKRVDAGRAGGIRSAEVRKQNQANEASASILKQTKQNQANEAVPVPVPVPAPVPVPDINNINNKPLRSPVFKPPTVEEVRAYCEERNSGIDAQAFVDFYASKGWMVGKNKMKDWHAAVRTWERGQNNGNRRNHADGEKRTGKQFAVKYDVC